MGSSSTLILSLKGILISTGVVSIALFMRLSVPLLMDFAIYEVPMIWATVLSWLRPPYLYVIINGIIITIAASSRFHRTHSESEPSVQAKPPPPSDLPLDFAPVSVRPEFGVLESPEVYEGVEAQVLDVMVNGSEVLVGEEDENEFVIARSTWKPPQRINSPEHRLTVTEKPLVSSRIGHRKPAKTRPEGGRALKVAKPKRHETLENTWKAITDGRHVPLTRHLKKSDTWENYGHHVNVVGPHEPSLENVTKSETFRDRTNIEPVAVALNSSPGSGGGGKLRKEASLSQDELNRRVEAFIKKFNEEMKMQRQESLTQYKEMVNRGAH